MTKEQRDYLITELIKLPKIRKIYDDYIIKEIPYEKWVADTAHYLLEGPRPVNIRQILNKIMEKWSNETQNSTRG